MAPVCKRGRPPKADGERYKCGLRVAPPDYGTIEQRVRREIAAGARSEASAAALLTAYEKVERINEGVPKHEKRSLRQLHEAGQLTAAEYNAMREFTQAVPLATGTDPIDILLARRIIDRDQFEVALDFTACWRAYIGRPWPKGWQAERQAPDHGGGFSEAHLRRMKIRYWNGVAAMNDANRTIYPLVRDVIIHGKHGGVISSILTLDIVRQDVDGGGLITRTAGVIPPSLRHRVGLLVNGLDIIADTPRGDFTREAEAMIEKIRCRSVEQSFTSP